METPLPFVKNTSSPIDEWPENKKVENMYDQNTRIDVIVTSKFQTYFQ